MVLKKSVLRWHEGRFCFKATLHNCLFSKINIIILCSGYDDPQGKCITFYGTNAIFKPNWRRVCGMRGCVFICAESNYFKTIRKYYFIFKYLAD